MKFFFHSVCPQGSLCTELEQASQYSALSGTHRLNFSGAHCCCAGDTGTPTEARHRTLWRSFGAGWVSRMVRTKHSE
jgi:hypothetical protein